MLDSLIDLKQKLDDPKNEGNCTNIQFILSSLLMLLIEKEEKERILTDCKILLNRKKEELKILNSESFIEELWERIDLND